MKRSTFGLLVLVVVLIVSMFCSCTSCSKSGQHYAKVEQRKTDSIEIASDYSFYYIVQTSSTLETTLYASLNDKNASTPILRYMIDITELSAQGKADTILYIEKQCDSLKRVMIGVDMRKLGY